MIAVFAVILTVGAILFTLLVRAKDVPPAEPPSPFQHLDEAKVRIYDNLRDLNFEYRVGKLSEEDYQRSKAGLQRELANVMTAIDELKQKLGLDVAQVAPPAVKQLNVCPHCGARFK